MRRVRSAFLLLLLVAPAASAQETTPEESKFRFKVDALLRQEWTRDIFVSATETRNESRRRARLLPRLELGGERLRIGVGGDFNFSSDCNLNVGNDCQQAEARPALLRDNYDSRDARLDLAFAHLEPMTWFKLDGGRFVMPVGLTEMIWDKDLRPQGGAATLEARDVAGFHRLAATALLAKGSHVFEDHDTRMLLLSGEASFPATGESRLTLTGSYLKFTHLDGLEPMIRRQNSRVADVPAPAPLASEFEVVDGVARFKHDGKVSTELVADYCWNRKAAEDNKGLWLALVLGSTQTAGGRLEYTYSKVDKDAVVAAYAQDDFFWSTGWEGHRVDLGVRSSDRTSFHAIGQLQRFYESPRVEEREHWVQRLRVELRASY